MTRIVGLSRISIVAALGVFQTACALLGPSCVDEQGAVLDRSGVASVGSTATYTVVSPRSSNLRMRLTWTNLEAVLGLRATIVDCGGHSGCVMGTSTPAAGPGGPGPVPPQWPPGVREMEVDGWQGKTYRVEIEGDPVRETPYAFSVGYRITCES